ncbi:MAG: ABC transporter ATP-binding protein [Ignavibacteriales bacterium]|nr:ABC transporter ATP-binding protein [Ignavibacteriales bacterium]
MIQIKNITKSFPSVVALNDVSLEIQDKSFYGLLGPNGAGKTTMMNLLIGYLQPEKGDLLIGGQKQTPENLNLRKNIGFVPQTIALYDDVSAQTNLEIFGSFFDIESKVLKERIVEQLNAVGLFERRKDLVKTYSGGMKRRLNIAASMLHNPEYLLCDEPTVGVDPQSRNAIFDLLQKLNSEGKTIIYTTHYMEEAERLCDKIAIIDSGKIIAEGTLSELVEQLPYDEAITIAKNKQTIQYRTELASFGTMLDHDDNFELKPNNGVPLSRFFEKVEQLGIGYQSVELHKPTLEALFLHLTGRTLRD